MTPARQPLWIYKREPAGMGEWCYRIYRNNHYMVYAESESIAMIICNGLNRDKSYSSTPAPAPDMPSSEPDHIHIKDGSDRDYRLISMYELQKIEHAINEECVGKNDGCPPGHLQEMHDRGNETINKVRSRPAPPAPETIIEKQTEEAFNTAEFPVFVQGTGWIRVRQAEQMFAATSAKAVREQVLKELDEWCQFNWEGEPCQDKRTAVFTFRQHIKSLRAQQKEK